MWGIEKFQEQWYIVQIEGQLKQWDHREIWHKKTLVQRLVQSFTEEGKEKSLDKIMQKLVYKNTSRMFVHM